MTENERIAIAARLHVALRRKTGRVTDTEWMAMNIDYAAAMVQFARTHAAETQDLELDGLASRLEFAMEPLVAAARVHAAAHSNRPGAPMAVRAALRYVGGLR